MKKTLELEHTLQLLLIFLSLLLLITVSFHFFFCMKEKETVSLSMTVVVVVVRAKQQKVIHRWTRPAVNAPDSRCNRRWCLRQHAHATDDDVCRRGCRWCCSAAAVSRSIAPATQPTTGATTSIPPQSVAVPARTDTSVVRCGPPTPATHRSIRFVPHRATPIMYILHNKYKIKICTLQT